MTIDPRGGHDDIRWTRSSRRIPEPPTTKYIKHERIQSERLTKFWGRPVLPGAHVLLPEGYDEHPDARYPLVIDHGHFPDTIDGFREEPPDPNLPALQRALRAGTATTGSSRSRRISSTRTGPGPNFPRMILVEIQHANPYYDDSYAVNSPTSDPTATRSPTS